MTDLETWRWTLEQLDRHLAGRDDVKVRWHGDAENGLAGYQRDCTLSLNRAVVAGWLESTGGDLRLMGLNFHELAHLMFTPAYACECREGCWSHGHERVAYNILEDQRSEAQLLAQFPQAKRALRALVMADGRDEFSPLTLLGRRHPPSEFREKAAIDFAAAHGDVALGRLEDVVEEYVPLTGTAFTSRMDELVNDMTWLCREIGYFSDADSLGEYAAEVEAGPEVMYDEDALRSMSLGCGRSPLPGPTRDFPAAERLPNRSGAVKRFVCGCSGTVSSPAQERNIHESDPDSATLCRGQRECRHVPSLDRR